MKRLITLLALTLIASATLAQSGTASVRTFENSGLEPLYLSRARSLSTDAVATDYMERHVARYAGATGAEQLTIRSNRIDRAGTRSIRFEQQINGMKVYGAGMVLNALEDGTVNFVAGEFVPAIDLPERPSTTRTAFRAALWTSGLGHAEIDDVPTLAYALDSKGDAFLAWTAVVSWEDKDGPHVERWFVDATVGGRRMVHALLHTAKDLATYDANNVSYTHSSMPGTLICTETSNNCNDAAGQDAHDGAGTVYDYYASKFGRDSLNGSGMQLVSSVHVLSNWNNAAWYNNQMIYGDGDGTTFTPLSGDLDVVAHELTHGVTDYESNLVYQNESGALNEAWSDIFGASAEAWSEGGVNSTTWLLGEDIYTPGTPGDALRYMDNPTADGYSADYYPERLYANNCSPSSNNDYCGVHGNSGIANLAYVLVVQGGTHPRSKTSINVTGIGLAKAEQIFYRAQTSCLTSSSNFQAARNCTAQAASDLYGTAEADAVHLAWDAVGVPGGTPPPVPELENGVPVTGLSGSTGSSQYFIMDVPAGATDLSFETVSSDPDADLYVKFGSQPTTSSYDCRSWTSSSNEICSFASPSTGTYHVLVYAYSSFTGLSLTGSYTDSGANNPPSASFTYSASDLAASFTDTSTDGDGSIVSWNWNFGDGASSSAQNPSHTYAADGTYTVTLTVTDDDGATDSTSSTLTVSSGGSTDPSSVHVASITAAKVDLGRGSKLGRATVVLEDDQGNPVGTAVVTGIFTGDVSGSPSGTTASNGSVTLDSNVGSGRMRFDFCVANVVHGSLPYDSSANTQTCVSVR